MLISLHGRGGDHWDTFAGSLHLHRFLAEAVAQGGAPFAIASVDGGDHEYWHPRRNTDPAAMVIEEFLPLLSKRGLDTTRIGLLGWSPASCGRRCRRFRPEASRRAATTPGTGAARQRRNCASPPPT